METQLPQKCVTCDEPVTVLYTVDHIPIFGGCALRHLSAVMQLTTHLGERRMLYMVDEFLKRPDLEAVKAVPALANKKALVLYFEDDTARDEFAELVKTVRGFSRSVKV